MKHLQWTQDKHHIIHLVFKHAVSKRNPFDHDLLTELEMLSQTLAELPEVEGLILTSGHADFCSGYDAKAMRPWANREMATAAATRLHGVFIQWSRLKFPTVAVIRGECLGAGLEWALACSWRLASDEPATRLGLPEIQWGLLPAGGGSQRLPRTIGLQAGLDMILTGRKVSAKKALKSGLVDACVPAPLLSSEAHQYAGRRGRSKALPMMTSSSQFSKDLPKWAIEGNPIGRKVMFKKARDMIDDKTKGFYPASYKALEAVFDGYDLPLEQGCQLEASLFGQLFVTRQSQCLLHLYEESQSHQEREAAWLPVPDLVGVVGAGFMGAGISLVAAERGIKVRLCDPNKQALGRALKSAHTALAKKVERRRLQAFEMQQRLALISPGLTTAGFKHCPLVIEAVPEDTALKQRILAELEAASSGDWVFASNTSAIPITEIAAAAVRPERVVGLHFFSPVDKMRLVEVVAAPDSAAWAIDRAVSFSHHLGKQVIIVKDSPGFFTTRTLAFYLAEALHLLAEGVPITAIDSALTQFGFGVGPLALIDDIGLDVGWHVLTAMAAPFAGRLTLPPFLSSLAGSGRLGRKNGRGFYLYEGERQREEDADLYKLVGTAPRPGELGHDEIVERCLLIFINEAVACLSDGVLQNAGDGDVGAVYGLGFPAFWGGPFKYIDVVGAQSIVENLYRLQEKLGERFTPAPLLVSMARSSKPFFASAARLAARA